MIPGIFAVRHYPALVDVPEVVDITSSVSSEYITDHEITLPPDLRTGDGLLLIVTARGSGATMNEVYPAEGWIKLGQAHTHVTSQTGTTVALLWLPWESGQVASTTIRTSHVSHVAAQCWRVRGYTGVPEVAIEGYSGATNTTPDPPALHTSRSGDILWICGFGSNGGAGPEEWPDGFDDYQTNTSSGLCRVNAASQVSSEKDMDPTPFIMGAATFRAAFTVAFGQVVVPVNRTLITIPAQEVELRNFPMLVDLEDMPEEFWGGLIYEDGRDIQAVLPGHDVFLPLDVIECSKQEKTGKVFVRRTLSDLEGTTVYLTGGGENRLEAMGEGVWSGYHRVLFPRISLQDRTGSGQEAVGAFNSIPVSPALGAHQGVCWDGTHYYVVDTNAIRKYDADWNLLLENSDPASLVGPPTDHCGDPDVVDGVIYIPLERYGSANDYSDMHIARYSAETLEGISATDISAQGHEASSIAYNPKDGLLYISSYADGTKLWKYDLSGAFQGTMPLSSTIGRIQGIVFSKGELWVSSGADNSNWFVPGHIWRGKDSGEDLRPLDWDKPTGVMEGITAVGDDILVLVDPGSGQSRVHLGREGGLYTIPADVFHTWTMAVSFKMTEPVPQTSAVITYGALNNTTNSTRATVGVRVGDILGLWNNSNSWLNAGEVELSESVRIHAVHDSTAYRALYYAGEETRQNTTVLRPSISPGALHIGRRDRFWGETFWNADFYFAYLHRSALPQAWIDAENSNLAAPGDFYSVGP